MNDGSTSPGGRLERRFLHALSSSGNVVQKRADVMMGRASRTVRRGSLVLAIGWLGLVGFAAAWVMFNLAMYGWASARWSTVTAYFVLMGINALGGGLLLLIAALLASRSKKQPGSRRARDLRHARSADGQPLLAAAPLEPAPPADSIESALGSAIELGLLAAQTIPQIVRAFRKPKPDSDSQA